MYLLNANTLQLEEFNGNDRPSYSILSHRWQPEEVTYRDVKDDTANTKKGFSKLRMACKRTLWDGLGYIWIDTCCIDKSSSAELSEAINSMYGWYAEADRCYAHLFDVSSPDPGEETNFRHSVWFERSWTLQELIAPAQVYFYDRNWREFGTRSSLCHVLESITNIPISRLSDGRLEDFPIAQRMSWAARRKATREEDVAYSLMGVFDVNMPLLYGEGAKAFIRLQEEIIKRSTDRTILLWNTPDTRVEEYYTVLAQKPSDFVTKAQWIQLQSDPFDEAFQITSAGLEMKVELYWCGVNEYCAVLRDSTSQKSEMFLTLRLVGLARDRLMVVKLGATLSPPSGFPHYREAHINILKYPRVQAPMTYQRLNVGDASAHNPFGDDCSIDSFVVSDLMILSGQAGEIPIWPNTWFRTVQIAGRNPKLYRRSYILNFAFGFDFCSRLVCFYGQSLSTSWNGLQNYPFISDVVASDGERPLSGVTHFTVGSGVESARYSTIISPHNKSVTTILTVPALFQVQLLFTTSATGNEWVFKLIPS